MRMLPDLRMELTVVCLVLGCFSYTGAVLPDLVAPDSNNIKTEFSPDDSAAGAMDTSKDNQNATPLVITNPPPTTPTTTTTTATTTTTPTTTPTTTTTTTPTTTTTTTPTTTPTTTTSTSTTTRPTTTTTTPTTTKRTTTTTTTTTTTERPLPLIITQAPVLPTVYRPSLNIYNPPYQNGFFFGPGQDPMQQPNTWQGRRTNIPWWMLLFEEI